MVEVELGKDLGASEDVDESRKIFDLMNVVGKIRENSFVQNGVVVGGGLDKNVDGKTLVIVLGAHLEIVDVEVKEFLVDTVDSEVGSMVLLSHLSELAEAEDVATDEGEHTLEIEYL